MFVDVDGVGDASVVLLRVFWWQPLRRSWVAMADRGPFSNRDMPRQGNSGYGNNTGYGGNSGYANSGYGSNNNNYNNNTGYVNTGYGNNTGGYGNNTGGYGNSAGGYGSSGGYGHNSYGNHDTFDRRGSVDVRKPHQQNAHRMRNSNRGPSAWQRGPVAPNMSWRDQGRPAEMGNRNSYHTPGGKTFTPLILQHKSYELRF